MKRLFALAILCAGLPLSMVATAQSGNIIGGDRGVAEIDGERGAQSTSAASATADMSAGEVRKVDSVAGKLTLSHGPLANLNMPAMTMVFRVRDPAWLHQLKVGERVRFVAERVDGNVMVTALEAEKQ